MQKILIKIKNFFQKLNRDFILSWVILIIIGSITSFLGIYISKNFKNENTSLNLTNDVIKKTEEIEKIIKPKQSEFPDYYNIKGENANSNLKQLLITNSCPLDGCVNDNPATIDFDGIEKEYKIEGKFSRAYLYIEAMVDYDRPLSIWDDVYFNIFWIGGHLITSENVLPVPPSNSSIYLYDLRSVSYYPTINDKELKVNAVKNINIFKRVLKDGRIVKVHASISSNRPGRKLKEISIYYECESESKCNITEFNK